ARAVIDLSAGTINQTHSTLYSTRIIMDIGLFLLSGRLQGGGHSVEWSSGFGLNASVSVSKR
ncbi:hypothetical protein JOQ06_018153, partial [Pogonophryne albipinna]